MGFAVETFALSKRYPHQRGLSDVFARRPVSETIALRDVTLTVSEGEVFGLLGPNGSGKTTFLKLLSTILLPSSGTARIFGHDILGEARTVRGLVALVTGEERSLYWRLTGRQNLEFYARLYGLDGKTTRYKVDELLELFDLREVGGGRVAEYSTGMRQKLAIARGLLGGPKLLFLDEPTRGLDPVAAHSLLIRVRERAVDYFDNTVVLTTHIAREVEQLCKRIAILKHGAVAYEGTVDDLRASLERHDNYTLTVSEVSDQSLEALRVRRGVKSCHRTSQSDGRTELELVLTQSVVALSDVLGYLLSNKVQILRCAKREQSFEEMFRAIVGQANPDGGRPPAND